MTGGNISYEFSKYGVMLFILMGIYSLAGSLGYSHFFFFIIGSVIISSFVLNFDTNIRTTIAFNISGPICLAVLYILIDENSDGTDESIIIYWASYSKLYYLTLYTPNIQDVITGTQSNFETSGGFGPNQVATFRTRNVCFFFHGLWNRRTKNAQRPDNFLSR
jgi:hypothetical protein